MKVSVFLSVWALPFGASAGALPLFPRDSGQCSAGSCAFTLSVSGGPVYENPTDAHQLAYGGSKPGAAVEFCISPQGVVTDNAGTCGITQNTGNDMETSQFQCDAGMTPNKTLAIASKFTISCTGQLEYNGSPNFYACLASQSIGYNIYASPPSSSQCASGQPNQITLQASNCAAQCPKPPPPPPPPPACPTNLNGEYQFPHLIVPVSKSMPNKAYGTSFDGEVTSDIASIFNFDIPPSYNGEQCSLVFLFPEQSQLVTSSFTFSGIGAIDFAWLSSPATLATTYSNAPGVSKDLGTVTVAPGNSYSITTFSCPAGHTIAFELSAKDSTSLTYFQDFNPSPIGLYITAC